MGEGALCPQPGVGQQKDNASLTGSCGFSAEKLSLFAFGLVTQSALPPAIWLQFACRRRDALSSPLMQTAATVS